MGDKITKTGAVTNDEYRSLRDPIMVGAYRLFGDVLPFIGFETLAVSKEYVEEEVGISVAEGVEEVVGNVFTIEWFGKGISLGGFRVPVDN